MEELFEVVDGNDVVIGLEPRSEVHRRGLNHRAVHVLIFNKAGALFLQKRSMAKDCFPGTWDTSAAGHLAPGESYDACALREVEEELGVSLGPAPERLFKLPASAQTGHEFIWVYRAAHEGPFILQEEEISEGGWFSVPRITRWIAERPADFADTVPLIWAELEERGMLEIR